MRRRLARARRWLSDKVPVVHRPGAGHAVPGLPIDPQRADRIVATLLEEGVIGPGDLHVPERASMWRLALAHDERWLEDLQRSETVAHVFGLPLDDALAQRLLATQRTGVGGTVLAAHLARRRGGLAVHLGGGFHHAGIDRGHGFCVFNDLAIAIRDLRLRAFNAPIVVIDLDLHDGDGTRAIFAADASVHTYSIHNAHWGQTDAVASTSIALGRGVKDGRYLEALTGTLPGVLDRMNPGLVFYVAGADPAASDPLGDWSVSQAGMLRRDKLVIRELRRRNVPTVWTLAGGYGSEAWRHTARGLLWALGGQRDPVVSSTASLTLRRYHRIAQDLVPEDLGKPDPLEFGPDDALAGFAAPRSDVRLLGFYSLHGIEFALERFGLLGQLRKLGFEPRVELEVDRQYGKPVGDTVRIYGEPGRACLLVEVRMRRDAATIPGANLMSIEWLLLQNPRGHFPRGRAPLPGQRHPGLRMFPDVLAMFVVMAKRLELDGLVVVPSHYHVAAQWRSHLRFAQPEMAARFDVLSEVVADMPLAQASRLIEGKRIVDGEGRPAYQPSAMVYASTQAARDYLDSPTYSKAYAAARARVVVTRLDASPGTEPSV